MTKTELTYNLTFHSAQNQLEYMASNGILTAPEAARVRKELERKLRPTLILA